MTKRDDNAGSPLPQTQNAATGQSELIEQLSQLEDKLHNLLACYQFVGEAIRLMTSPEHDLLDNSEQWHLGLFLNQQWLQQQGGQVMQELLSLKRSLKT